MSSSLRSLLCAALCAGAIFVPLVACDKTPDEAAPAPSQSSDQGAASETPPEVAPEVAPTEALARVPQSWIEARVKKAEARLSASPAGEKVARAITAHGGLERWYANGPIQFRFRYAPVGDESKVRDTRQLVDTWRSRAVHTMVDDATHHFGWDGERAWADFDAKTSSPRFWSLTPYYFVGVPFVFADEGITLVDEGPIEFEGKAYDQIRVTFAAGTGDAPDDFYVMYLEQETGRVGGVRYVVSYPGFFPDGGHSPEKFMAYDGAQVIDGITLPQSFRTFAWDVEGKAPKEKVTDTTLSEVSFLPETPEAAFHVPQGAQVLDGM